MYSPIWIMKMCAALKYKISAQMVALASGNISSPQVGVLGANTGRLPLKQLNALYIN